MIGRIIIFLALAVWGVVVGCVLTQDTATPAPGLVLAERGGAGQAGAGAVRPTRVDGSDSWLAKVPAGVRVSHLPMRSMTVQIQRTDWMEKYKVCVDEIAALGADTVLFVVDPRQENGSSGRIYLDLRMTPGPDALSDLIRHAKGKGLRVMLMPIVLLDAPRTEGNEWRGTINPPSWDSWFDSYRDMITHFAWIAEGSGVDVLVVGSELVSSEKEKEQWVRTIHQVRGVFHGLITYSSNWDRYHLVPFWDQVDMIGLNSYWRLDNGQKQKATVADIQHDWQKVIMPDLLPFAAKQGKPILFLEAGWCSLQNSAHESWDYTRTELPADPELQARLYEGFLSTWYGHPQLAGFSVWEWQPADAGDQEKGYTPRGKPALEVLKRYWKMGGWAVSGAASASGNTPAVNQTATPPNPPGDPHGTGATDANH